MFDISVRSNVKAFNKLISGIERDQLPFATVLTLNELAKEVHADESENIGKTFNKPKPFTRKSVGMRKARKSDLEALVFVKPIAARYLNPYEEGGDHVLPGNSKAILNPKNLRLNQYGQLPRNILARLKARPDVFIGPVKTKHGEVNGVWQRIPPKKVGRASRGAAQSPNNAAHLKLLIRFGDAIEVKKHLNYRSRAKALIGRRVDVLLRKNMKAALATAR